MRKRTPAENAHVARLMGEYDLAVARVEVLKSRLGDLGMEMRKAPWHWRTHQRWTTGELSDSGYADDLIARGEPEDSVLIQLLREAERR